MVSLENSSKRDILLCKAKSTNILSQFRKLLHRNIRVSSLCKYTQTGIRWEDLCKIYSHTCFIVVLHHSFSLKFSGKTSSPYPHKSLIFFLKEFLTWHAFKTWCFAVYNDYKLKLKSIYWNLMAWDAQQPSWNLWTVLTRKKWPKTEKNFSLLRLTFEKLLRI